MQPAMCESCAQRPAVHLVDFGGMGSVFACCAQCAGEAADRGLVVLSPLPTEEGAP